MTETAEATSEIKGGRGRDRLDLGLTMVAWVLVIGLLAFSAYFAYSVKAVWDAEAMATPAQRTIRALKDRVKEKPDDPLRRVRLAEALGAAGYTNQSIEQLQVAIKLDPKYVGAYMDLGFIGMIEKDYPNAEKAFNKVLSLTTGGEFENINEFREQSYYYLGEIAIVEERFEDAAGFFKAAIRIRRDASDTYVRLAQAFIGMEEYDSAEGQLRIAMEYDPNFAEAHYELGKIHLARKEMVDAAWQFRIAADLAPKSELPREALASLGEFEQFFEKAKAAYADDDREEALEMVKIARALDKQQVEGYRLHARILEEDGDLKAALQVYKEGVAALPDDKQLAAEVTRLSKLVDKEGKK